MRIFVCLVVSIAFASSLSLAAEETRSIYLLRHAEKQKSSENDPSLTKRGIQRAEKIAEYLSTKNIERLFSTNYRRTLETLTPLAKRLNLKLENYDPSQLELFAQKLRNTSSNLVIVGHSNTTPLLVKLLGGKDLGNISEEEYDRLYHLTKRGDKVYTELLSSDMMQKDQ